MAQESVSSGDARRDFAEIVNRVAFGKERVTITRHGQKVVAIVPIEDVDLLEAIEDQVDIASARKAMKEKGSISLDDVIERYG